MRESNKFIVLGFTHTVRSSKAIIGRYKDENEIRDLLVGDVRAARRAARTFNSIIDILH